MDKSMNRGAEEARESELHSNASKARIGAHAPVSLGRLLSALWRDTSDLLTQQADLAKAEASEKVKQLGVGVGAIAGSGAVILAGLIICCSRPSTRLHRISIPNIQHGSPR